MSEALQVIQHGEAAPFMPVMDVQKAVERREAIVQFVKKLMKENDDFGTIPGTKKPCLYKAGAEKLSSFFGMEPEFEPIQEVADWTGKEHNGEVFYYIRYRCVIWRNGKRIAMQEGSCNSWESKYRYRWVSEDQIPPGLSKDLLVQQDGTRAHTEFEFAIEKAETSGKYGKPAEYWQEFKDAIAAGRAKAGEKEIKGGRKSKTWTLTIESKLYRVPNPDIADQVNTIQKMAQKRAFVGAMLIATGASQFFTQDLGDNQPDDSDLSPVDLALKQFKSASREMRADSFQFLIGKMRELTGDDIAFERILHEEAKVKKMQDLKSLGDACKVFRRMWLTVENLSSEPSEDDAAF